MYVYDLYIFIIFLQSKLHPKSSKSLLWFHNHHDTRFKNQYTMDYLHLRKDSFILSPILYISISMSLKNTIVWFLDKSLFWHSEKHITGSQYAIRTLFILWILLFVYISVYNMNFLFAFSRTIEEQVLEWCILQGMVFIWLTIIGMHGAQIIKYLSHVRVLSRNNIPLIWRGIIFTFFTSVICIIEWWILYTWQTNPIYRDIFFFQILWSLAILFWWSIYMFTRKKTARDISIPLQNTDTWDKAEIHHPDMAGNILKKYFRTNQENTLSRKTYFIRMVVSILAFIGYASSVMLFCSTAYLYIKKITPSSTLDFWKISYSLS